MADIFKIL